MVAGMGGPLKEKSHDARLGRPGAEVTLASLCKRGRGPAQPMLLGGKLSFLQPGSQGIRNLRPLPQWCPGAAPAGREPAR